MEKFVNVITEKATSIGLTLIYALLVLIIGLRLAKWASNKLLKMNALEKVDVSTRHVLASAVKIFLYTLVIVSAAIIIGIPATTFVAILGSAGLAIGLALQGSLSNLAGSIMILLFKPFKVGDFVEYGSFSGTVEDINLFYTVLTTPDNKVITCPNGALSNSNVTNYSSKDIRRVDLTYSAEYGTDIDMVKNIMLKCARNDKRVLVAPAPVAFLSEPTESALKFLLRVWCDGSDYWGVYFDLIENVRKDLAAEGINAPYNQLDIHVKR